MLAYYEAKIPSELSCYKNMGILRLLTDLLKLVGSSSDVIPSLHVLDLWT